MIDIIFIIIFFTMVIMLSCKVIYFTAYLIGIIFIYFCNIVKIILRTPLRSLGLFFGLIMGPFICFTKELCVPDLKMYNM